VRAHAAHGGAIRSQHEDDGAVHLKISWSLRAGGERRGGRRRTPRPA
jgi:hypothetical protein